LRAKGVDDIRAGRLSQCRSVEQRSRLAWLCEWMMGQQNIPSGELERGARLITRAAGVGMGG